MFRITVTAHGGGTAIRLEGRLAGAWADELHTCWQQLRTERAMGPVCIDLHGVTFIDAAGKALLHVLHEQGAALSATECMTRAIVEEITG
jgi:anti-anti-sigma regulatory factor